MCPGRGADGFGRPPPPIPDQIPLMSQAVVRATRHRRTVVAVQVPDRLRTARR